MESEVWMWRMSERMDIFLRWQSSPACKRDIIYLKVVRRTTEITILEILENWTFFEVFFN